MYKYLTLFISSLFLFGCNSGSDPVSTPPETPTEVLINAESLQDKALLGTEGIVNVQAATSSDVELELTSVTPMSYASNCKIDSIDGMAFSLSAEQVGECQFEYTVGPRDTEAFVGKASAIARVSVSETASDNTLPNLSETTDRLTEITLDLNAALSGDLDTSSYVVSGDISVLGTGSATAEPSTNKITFTPSEIGVDRVLYSMSDGSTTKLGTIDIAVSDTVNTPPVAENKVLEGKLAKDMLVTIDLTDYVSDAEDVVLLDSVRAYNAEANITSQTEHTFTFKSSQPGPHEIAYTIADGRGGYDVGQVYIEVEPDFDLVQDWEDITIADPTIGADITFTAPISKAMADYINADYITEFVESGEFGPQGAKMVLMDWYQAKQYCSTRGGRLPMTRELEALQLEDPFNKHNWPSEVVYWAVDMLSESSARTVNLNSGESSSGDTKGSASYVTCIYLDGNAKNFSIDSVASDDLGVPTSTTRYITSTLLDPDGQPAPFQDIKFWTRLDVGGFGATNTEMEAVEQSDASGVSTAVYEFTKGYEDHIMAQYDDSAGFTTVTFAEGGFDVTNPNDWNVSKIQGSTPLANYEPIISSNGTKVAVGQTSQYVTSIAKKPLIGTNVDIKFGLDRTTTDNLSAGNTNIIIQQVSSKAPDVNSSCDIEVFGDCSWSTSQKEEAGIPQHDERWFAFMFDYYGSSPKIYLKNASGILAQGALTNRHLTKLYYQIVIDGTVVSIYQATKSDLSDKQLSLTQDVSNYGIDTSEFYYFGLSGGAHGNSGVRALIHSLNITVSEN
ncbi:Ig-like domain-containing protein [Vibrio campbellii]|uniref:Ig-like domain-containing protein n=1 Tax=Vibrio campbellii TaxID=680 RepID=UPI003F82A8A7